jgi:hypothetical protein
MAKSSDLLSRRALNRALLARQLLLERSTISPAKAVEHLVGLQAQNPGNPYVGLWSRLEKFQPQELSRLIETRKAVRIALQRSTIHLVGSRDAFGIRPLVQPVLERTFSSNHGKKLPQADLAKITATGRQLVEEEPRTFAVLGALLQKRWPRCTPLDLAQAVRTFVPLVQIPPRGLWGGSGQATHTSLEHWCSASRARASFAIDELVLRYLGAFGPATVSDAQAWSGLTRLKEVFERLRPKLKTFRDEDGRERFDLPGAPRPDGNVSAPPRFLPEYDNVSLSHADRSHILADDHRRLFSGANGNLFGSVLIDGFATARWRIQCEPKTAKAVLLVETAGALTKQTRSLLADEAERLVAFSEADVEHREVRINQL